LAPPSALATQLVQLALSQDLHPTSLDTNQCTPNFPGGATFQSLADERLTRAAAVPLGGPGVHVGFIALKDPRHEDNTTKAIVQPAKTTRISYKLKKLDPAKSSITPAVAFHQANQAERSLASNLL